MVHDFYLPFLGQHRAKLISRLACAGRDQQYKFKDVRHNKIPHGYKKGSYPTSQSVYHGFETRERDRASQSKGRDLATSASSPARHKRNTSQG